MTPTTKIDAGFWQGSKVTIYVNPRKLDRLIARAAKNRTRRAAGCGGGVIVQVGAPRRWP